MAVPDWFEETLARQLAMTPQTWAALQSHGVDESTPLRLDFLFRAPAEQAAEELAAFLKLETDYAIEVDFERDADGEPVDWSVAGSTDPTAVSQAILEDWVRWLVAAGASYGPCVFDGWGAAVGG
ncbi:MAG: ribonuclease E inhibitor RraB [Solirubrobacteraceae bacterium]|nr:ribonuclease E inhibitor RraB [Patulibacter sp.]